MSTYQVKNSLFNIMIKLEKNFEWSNRVFRIHIYIMTIMRPTRRFHGRFQLGTNPLAREYPGNWAEKKERPR